jgi:chromosomal replication initiation ATPase DnaA
MSHETALFRKRNHESVVWRLRSFRALFPEVEIPSIRTIVEAVARKHGIAPLQLLGERRCKKLVLARQEAMWVAVRDSGRSLPVIGREMGNRDHTTVYYGCQRHQGRINRGEAVPFNLPPYPDERLS